MNIERSFKVNVFLQNRCLVCHEVISPSIGWKAIFSVEHEHHICSLCEGKLEKMDGDQCQICSRPFNQIDDKFRNGDVCQDCCRWEEDPKWQGTLEKNHSLFHYNDFLKEVIATFKFRG